LTPTTRTSAAFQNSWLAHAERYVADMSGRFNLGYQSHVIEVAANDGYLLQYVKAATSPASASSRRQAPPLPPVKKAYRSSKTFFTVSLARQLVVEGKQSGPYRSQ